MIKVYISCPQNYRVFWKLFTDAKALLNALSFTQNGDKFSSKVSNFKVT